jgi:hypothetical protein
MHRKKLGAMETPRMARLTVPSTAVAAQMQAPRVLDVQH